jgi:uncharacterized UPF0146 family protein
LLFDVGASRVKFVAADGQRHVALAVVGVVPGDIELTSMLFRRSSVEVPKLPQYMQAELIFAIVGGTELSRYTELL